MLCLFNYINTRGRPHPSSPSPRPPRFISLSLSSLRFLRSQAAAFSLLILISRSAMKRLIGRLSRVADSSQYRPVRAEKEEGGGQGRRRKVPEGHVPVYVGEEMERFAVRAELLGRPAFVELLRRSAQEYGYDQRGVLRIPCPVPLFRQILYFLASGAGAAGDLALEELFGWLPDEIPSVSPS